MQYNEFYISVKDGDMVAIPKDYFRAGNAFTQNGSSHKMDKIETIQMWNQNKNLLRFNSRCEKVYVLVAEDVLTTHHLPPNPMGYFMQF